MNAQAVNPNETAKLLIEQRAIEHGRGNVAQFGFTKSVI